MTVAWALSEVYAELGAIDTPLEKGWFNLSVHLFFPFQSIASLLLTDSHQSLGLRVKSFY